MALNCGATVLTFATSVAPVQEFALNLALMKLLAITFGIDARFALPSALHAFLACKKHVKCKKKIPSFTYYTVIPYRASTGPEHGFPCEFFHTGKSRFSLQGNPVLITGTLFSLQEFLCFHYREWVCSVHINFFFCHSHLQFNVGTK